MSGTWFWSDLHIDHEFVAGTRGFDSAAEHDAELARRWDKTVRPGDIVWLCGDLTGRRGSEHNGLAWLAQRPGKIIFVPGNHDACHGMHADAYKRMPDYLEVVDAVIERASRKIAGRRVLLSHFPYDEDHSSFIRYTQWRYPDEGKWLIHGHTHSTIQQRGRELHVGVDAHPDGPVPLKWIEDRIRDGAHE
ncbi:metallophosphoesterase family protein [Nocardia cyriacigeorgica]|uniref:metallophosphoesterase family protein n=1 Tax=Nocardia cyriacigeorgica TaxID=135487 RepID=UPI00189379A9|nr:metallophosphoesterase family protein [Nocardia cyriacigeorgica]MBF6085137.1 metallophosphoesterase family protein [Nocardia cyriacigeorgica]